MSRDHGAAISLEPGAQSVSRPRGAAGELIPCSTAKSLKSDYSNDALSLSICKIIYTLFVLNESTSFVFTMLLTHLVLSE